MISTHDVVKALAGMLEDYARDVDKEAREYPDVPMLPKTDESWEGFAADAARVWAALAVQGWQAPEVSDPGN